MATHKKDVDMVDLTMPDRSAKRSTGDVHLGAWQLFMDINGEVFESPAATNKGGALCDVEDFGDGSSDTSWSDMSLSQLATPVKD